MDLKVRISKRAVCKSNLTKFKNAFQKIKSLPVDIDTVLELEGKIQAIELTMVDFETIQFEIEQIASGDAEHVIDDKERDLFQKDYYSTVPQAKQYVKTHKPSNNLGTSRPSPTDTEESALRVHNSLLKLPALNLPIFSGNYNNWLEFSDAFTSMVHDNSILTNIQKMHYLKSSVSGDAAKTIQSVIKSANSYQIAWDLLVERYQNNRVIVNKLYAELVSIESTNEESAVGLRHIVETASTQLRSLKTIEKEEEQYSNLLIYILSSKIDPITRRDWEISCKDRFPHVDEFLKFIRSKCGILEAMGENKVLRTPQLKQQRSGTKAFLTKTGNNKDVVCVFCKDKHLIYTCAKFASLSVEARVDQVRTMKLCFKCLRNNHTTQNCRSISCKKCSKPHHTLLHFERDRAHNPIQVTPNAVHTGGPNAPPTQTVLASMPSTSNQTVITGHYLNHNPSNNCEVLLSTASINVVSGNGQTIISRALLDNGAQMSFITETLYRKLGLVSKSINMTVSGVNGACSRASKSVDIVIQSLHNSFVAEIQCLIVPEITTNLPSTTIPKDKIVVPLGIELADPDFFMSSGVDILLGADIFYNLLTPGQIALGYGLPRLQNTQLGWIVGGQYKSGAFKVIKSHHCVIHNDINCDIAKLWDEQEIVNTELQLSNEERLCETIFTNTIRRDPDGKFCVSVPFKTESASLGNSRQSALNRFYSLERKLDNNESLKTEYVKFLKEYISLGHMTLINEVDSPHSQNFYIPHHPVINENSTTTRLRVVFDASMKSDVGLSLNDVQLIGPTIQQDLLQLLLRFREHKIVFTADIEKMYRQVWINENDRKFHRIFWRENKSDELRCYELNTITYGTSSAPFLAVRCLFQLADDMAQEFPVESEIMKRDFYVDDLISGANTVDEAINIANNITHILNSAGMPLRKWCSNNNAVVSSQETTIAQIGDNTNKILGIFWNSTSDSLFFKVNPNWEKSPTITKRSVLSVTAQIYDPLGVISAFTIRARLILKQLWKEHITWDEPIPTLELHKWHRFLGELKDINILIPRPTIASQVVEVELVGFCDASVHCYAACVYLRSKSQHNCWESHLLCAKGKVAPIKEVSVARLELCGAVLLSKLVKKVRESLTTPLAAEYLWTDSTIVLDWLRSSPSRWKPYVANRVTEIHEHTVPSTWHHVRTHENPADIVTREISIAHLNTNTLWWSGPDWLQKSKANWPSSTFDIVEKPETLIEQRSITKVTCAAVVMLDYLTNLSSFTKIIRVTAYCRRFIHNKFNPNSQKSGVLSIDELKTAELRIIKNIQHHEFSGEIQEISANKINTKSKISSLSPVLDSDGLIRVGGRLQNTRFAYAKRHPILLPNKHVLTALLMRKVHIENLHCGPQALLAIVRDKYWPIGGRYIARKIVRSCVVCFKCRPVINQPIIGQLPLDRATAAPPFSITGVDYAGPILMRDKKSRGCKSLKAYICVFICFVTKAIHLELVGDLTTEAFIAALRRFAARRGKPNSIYSDNATNFCGANNELHKLISLKKNAVQVQESLHSEGISWHFIPPKSPSFGGLWEAGVKSVKYHLARVVGEAKLIYEELYTVLTQIESVLNSRPLCPISQDPNDLYALTPAHFLIGRPLTSVADVDLLDVPTNRLSHYQRAQQLQQHFWSRWAKEYINQLQQRPKAAPRPSVPIQMGTMVLVRDINLPPLQWPLGRIVELFPGKDGQVRVVNVRTKSGTYKRAVRELAMLPIEQ